MFTILNMNKIKHRVIEAKLKHTPANCESTQEQCMVFF